MARMLADVQDIGIGDDARKDAFRLIRRDASLLEVKAVSGLARRLGAGEDPAILAGDNDGEGAVLRHLLASVLDVKYAQSMKFRSLAAAPTEVSNIRAFAKTMRDAVLLKKAQVDTLYGPPRTRLGYLGWRLWRPFDLIVKAGRYAAAWVAHRLRIRN